MSNRRFVIVFSVAHFLWLFTFNFVFFYLPNHLRNIGLGNAQIGVLQAIPSTVTLAMVIPFGVITDRFSPKLLVMAGILGFGVFAAGLSEASHFFSLFVLYVIGGIGCTLLMVCLNALYYKHLGTVNRGMRLGYFLAGAQTGYIVAPLFNAALQTSQGMSMESIFLCGGALSLVFFLWCFLLPDAAPIPFRILEYRHDLAKKKVMLLMVLTFVWSLHIGHELTSYTLFMERTLGMSRYAMAIVFLATGVSFPTLTVFLGRWFDRTQRFLLITFVGLFVCGFVLVITPLLGVGLKSMTALNVIHTAGDAGVLFGTRLFVALVFPGHRVGGNYGVTLAARTLGITCGAYLCGYLNRLFPSYGPSFIGIGAFQVALSLFCLANLQGLRRIVRVGLSTAGEEAKITAEQQSQPPLSTP